MIYISIIGIIYDILYISHIIHYYEINICKVNYTYNILQLL